MSPGKSFDYAKRPRGVLFLKLSSWTLPFLFFIFLPSQAPAALQNTLYRIQVKPHSGHTRITFRLENESDFSMSVLSGRRLKIIFPATSSLQSGKLRVYSDPHITGISFAERNNNTVVTVAVKGDSGWRLMAPVHANLVTLDVGPGIKGAEREPLQPGREGIRTVAEKLVRDFEPPLGRDAPFIPTHIKLLRKLMPEPDAKLFLQGEAALYEEKPSEAEEAFRRFLDSDPVVRAIALWRIGEALHMMGKYPAALSAFREGEKLNPEYMARNPRAVLHYADSLVRVGDFDAGRRLLGRLINEMQDRDRGLTMLVRLADMHMRAGREQEALSIYRNLRSNFPGTRAYYSASMRLNDRRFFAVNSVTCRGLIAGYRATYAAGVDAALRDESLFKAALLEALFGRAGDAVNAVAEYERKYPLGIFSDIAKTIHEDLLLDLYRELEKNGDCRRLPGMVEENRKYLGKCLAEEGFLRLISKCYAAGGKTREEMELFTQLVDDERAAASAPFLYSRILEDAQALNNEALAEGAARAFLQKFPKHPLVWGMIGRLGEICYLKGNMPEVISVLGRLEEKGSRVERPESLYYLGKAREKLNELAAAERAMTLFLDELRRKGSISPFQADAYLVKASARLSKGDAGGAMSVYRAGYEASQGEFRDAFLFKMADLSRKGGNHEAAEKMWERLVAEGTDPFWKKMAAKELSDLEWREKWMSK